MPPIDRADDVEPLLRPAKVWGREEVLGRPSPVPAAPGVYAWYFDVPPAGVPIDDCHSPDAGHLLYVGISPKAPSKGPAAKPSRQSLRTRLRSHYRGNASQSTLRLTLGSLLADELGIALRRVGSGQRLTFADGEATLNDWMSRHARVCWLESPQPWLLESNLIATLTLPLNLDQNAHSGFRATLRARRAAQRQSARALPVVAR